jgi:hypothetical protein
MRFCISLAFDLRVNRNLLAGFNLSFVWLKLVDGNGILFILYKRIGVRDNACGRCLWTLPKITNITKKLPLRIWLRIRGYLADAASQINDYLARSASASRQWSGHFVYYDQVCGSATTFDDVCSIISALVDVRRLRELRLAIQNWIVVFANSKIIMIQSAVRGWLVRFRFSFDTSNADVIGDAVVLTASEAVSAVTRMSGTSRQFRSAITFAVDDWLSGWRSWITIFDTAAMINMIAERVVDSSWKYVDGNSAWSSVTSVDGVKIAVGGRVIIPGHAMVLNGRILPMIATVVKSIPNWFCVCVVNHMHMHWCCGLHSSQGNG